MRRQVGLVINVLAFSIAFSGIAFGQEDGGAEGQDIEESRSFLADKGLSFDAAYILDWSRISTGDIRKRSTSRDLLDLTLELNLEELFVLRGGMFFAEYHSKRSRNGSEDVSDIQGFSNIDEDDVHHLA